MAVGLCKHWEWHGEEEVAGPQIFLLSSVISKRVT